MLLNIYPANILLDKMTVSEIDKCTFCPGAIDFLEPLFRECPTVVKFRESIQQKSHSETGLRMELSVQTILFSATKLYICKI